MASPTPTRLDSLPVEIIKRIASFSPTTSVLALFLVSRHLRNVCNDEMIFKAIISNRNNENNQYLRANKEDDWSPPPSTTEHARYALADLRAREWQTLPHNWVSSEVTPKEVSMNVCYKDNYVGATLWAPKLASLHHPFINSLHVDACLDSLSKACSDVARLGLNFVVTNALLTQIRRLMLGRVTFGTDQSIKTLLIEKPVAPNPLDHIPSVALVALHLFRSSQKYRGIISIPLPSPSKIPFPADYLPSPFSDITVKQLNTSHLREMTSKNYLEEGEWIGYYSYGSDFSVPQVPFDPPMTGMHFNVASDLLSDRVGTNTNLEITRITANGRDKVGSFSLVGTISSMGEVKCRKIYDTGSWWWNWNAKMTPFGIVGNWGRNEAWEDDGQGCLWLWKREWSE